MQSTGVLEDGLKSDNNVEVMEATSKISKKERFEEDAIDTIAQSRGKCSKRYKTKADIVIRLQNVAVFPSDASLIYSFGTKRIKIIP